MNYVFLAVHTHLVFYQCQRQGPFLAPSTATEEDGAFPFHYSLLGMTESMQVSLHETPTQTPVSHLHTQFAFRNV